TGRIHVFHLAVVWFYAPSNLGGTEGMQRQCICSHLRWFQSSYPWCDTVFVMLDQDLEGMCTMVIARILLFFSFTYDSKVYSCALVNWFQCTSNEPDPVTGLWQVKPEFDASGQCTLSIIHVDAIVCSTHLLPFFGWSSLPENFHFSLSLDVFRSYFVNKYVDNHCHSLLHNK
ncbi:hypothetical protein BDQ17DRAFT_1252297, partial [Cyathus striatus]